MFDERVNLGRRILEPFIFQRKKEQVLDLPKKSHRVAYCDLHKATAPDIQRPYEWEVGVRHHLVCTAEGHQGTCSGGKDG
jgi:hypothetical protein